MNKLNTSVMIFFSPHLFKTIKNTISLYKTLLFLSSLCFKFTINDREQKMSGAAEPSLCGFFAVHAIVVFADDSRVCFILLEKLLVGGTTQGLLFFSFCVSTRWHEHDKTNHYVPIPESIIQSFLCSFAFHVVFSSFSVSEHHSSPQVCPGPMLPWWSSALG